jgi:hypothetical protein
LPIYRNLRYFTLDLRLKIWILHTPIMRVVLGRNPGHIFKNACGFSRDTPFPSE